MAGLMTWCGGKDSFQRSRIAHKLCNPGASSLAIRCPALCFALQLEELLNHSSPFSIWMDGERVDSLLDEDKQQSRWLEDLEERYGLVEDSVDDLFQESTRAYGHLHPFFHSPFAGGFQEALRSPFRSPRLPSTRVVRDLPSPFFRLHDPTQSFQHLFQPLFEMTQRMFEGAQRAMENDRHWFGKGWDSLPGGVSTGG